ncbi:MAG: HAD family hydrolase [Bradyrhizobium sp.]|uniref:HAD-IIIC family phosphatase n=1 Tax=Bradyrhizobium sp. TaxID=376 RepID=UPI001C28EBBF|nr:HAD-IIIC family phosphatase [Bradyrhizobium sp.]MBU6461261.1 HAD-IIIC family phosphatase [Pseudomonadota bacterium]MDE2065743.1 HAD family hydrolase [Bradyrhizobium sp.]
MTPNKIIRLAILADFSTQSLAPILKALCARHGVGLEIYEAAFDSIDIEVIDPTSELYKFKPHYVAIIMTTQQLRGKIYAAGSRKDFAESATRHLVELWSRIAERSSAQLVQATFVLPAERAFGNYEVKVPHSVGAIIADLNHGIIDAARQAGNVLICDTDFIAAEAGRQKWFDDRLWILSKALCSFDAMPRFGRSLTDIILAADGRAVKCVALDLDGTLWGGTIGDDGLESIRLGELDDGEAFVEFQHFLLELKRRGIILAVVSKNERHHALLPFQKHPDMVLKEEDIAVFIANWENKADNIKTVRRILNIGFDSIVFLDDNPFERGLVRELLPDVIVPELPDDPSLFLSTLADLALFETTSYSQADENRVAQYRQEAARHELSNEFSDIDSYLVSLDMTMKVERFSEFNLPRIVQLMQRSNQFNLTTRRYSESACTKLMCDPDYYTLTMSLKDKFGDSGLISIIILKMSDAVVIDEFLMSCRVLKRGVEAFAMNAIFELARQRGSHSVVGSYLPTPKNGMVRDFYPGFGFARVEETLHGETTWRMDVEAYSPLPHHINSWPLGEISNDPS